jgi:hypothetical protein
MKRKLTPTLIITLKAIVLNIKVRVIIFLWLISFIDSVMFERKNKDYYFKCLLLALRFRNLAINNSRHKPPKFEKGGVDFTIDPKIYLNNGKVIILSSNTIRNK